MKKRKIFQLLLGSGSSLLAAAILKIFIPGQSWTEFVAWVIFFIAMQSPWIFYEERKLQLPGLVSPKNIKLGFINFHLISYNRLHSNWFKTCTWFRYC